ncbi:MAG TPA: protease modulator HflC [Steroidobacteraceae bacterium]|nr:protease modulator HflC [Steroidobacteraceae bacterium]
MAARLLIALGVALATLLLWRSCYIINEGEIALRTRFGQIDGAQYSPGLHLKSPLDEVHILDRRILTRAYPGERFLTRDQKALSVDFYVKWQLLDAARFFQATGADEDMAGLRLADIIRDRLKSAVAGQPLTKVISDPRGTLSDAGFNDIGAAAGELGVQLIDVQLQRIDLTDDVAAAVYQRMQQSQIAQAQQQRASGVADAAKIRADAERKRAEILADATREGQRIRGEADARAGAAYAKAYARNPEFAAFYRSMQAYKNTLGRDGDILVIAPEGEFFKYLHSASGR